MGSTRHFPPLCGVFVILLTFSGVRALPAESAPFLRGDADASGGINSTDAVFTLNWLFLGGVNPPCLDAVDSDDSGTLDVSDPIHTLSWLFLGGDEPPGPGPETCGVDPTEDDLGCVYYQPCAPGVPQRRGLMLLIEYEGVEGLTNFVYELQERDIPALLLASSMFVAEHCDTIRTLQDYGLEVAAHCGPQLWDVPYEEQYTRVANTRDAMEACLGRPIRIISSRYMATDENTLRVAQELDIPYVLARGTTGTRATIYQPEEYTVRIISVSNMTSERWAFGSLCDYSVWARGGTPEEFSAELQDALKHDKLTPVSHTHISGLALRWYSVYMDFLDNSGVEFLDLDAFAQPDLTLPVSEIPLNKHVPYGAAPDPLVPLEDEPNVDNPCSIDDFPPVTGSGDVGNRIVFFHNGVGPMCLDFLAFLETIDYSVEEHLLGDPEFWDDLEALKTEFGSSEGVSQTFGFFPIIFIQERAFSGFNADVEQEILSLVASE